MNKLQILVFIQFLESVPTFVEMGFVIKPGFVILSWHFCSWSHLVKKNLHIIADTTPITQPLSHNP